MPKVKNLSSERIAIRFSKDIDRKINGLAVTQKVPKTTIVRQMVARGLAAQEEGFLSDQMMKLLSRISLTANTNQKFIRITSEINILQTALLMAILSKTGDFSNDMDTEEKQMLISLMEKGGELSRMFIDDIVKKVNKKTDHLSVAVKDDVEGSDDDGQNNQDIENDDDNMESDGHDEKEKSDNE